LALAALALVVFGAYDSYPKFRVRTTAVICCLRWQQRGGGPGHCARGSGPGMQRANPGVLGGMDQWEEVAVGRRSVRPPRRPCAHLRHPSWPQFSLLRHQPAAKGNARLFRIQGKVQYFTSLLSRPKYNYIPFIEQIDLFRWIRQLSRLPVPKIIRYCYVSKNLGISSDFWAKGRNIPGDIFRGDFFFALSLPNIQKHIAYFKVNLFIYF